jgi:hypothetical protein
MGRYLLNEDGESTGIFVEKCAVNLSLADIVDAYTTVAISEFERDYKARLEDPSFYCDVEDMEIESDIINSEYNIFPKQPEHLIVRNRSWIEMNYNYKPALPKRVFDTRYFRLTEVKPNNG